MNSSLLMMYRIIQDSQWIDSLERFLKSEVTVPEYPIFTSAIVAALTLIEQGKGK
ncbi:MAG TPA: hypothetical protein VJZ49_12935 [Syntrophales bacterium]|nr:hypothetical protein [Syntrophales bacterium]